MTDQRELALACRHADEAIRRLINIRNQVVIMADMVHREYHKEPKYWRQCKHPICRQFYRYMKDETTDSALHAPKESE